MPVPVLRWSPTKWRKAEALRDRIMRDVGTDEPWVVEDMTKQLGDLAVAVHYRRPLRITEINRMALTETVKARPGRGYEHENRPGICRTSHRPEPPRPWCS
jgi:hypothetical protein